MSARKSVLVIDDSQAVLDVLETAFDEAGFAVTAARDGEEVFRRMAEVEPEAVLLDLYLPRLNCADVCRVVKTHPRWKKIYLVLMSSRLSDRELDMYRRLGADEILRKPFDPAQAVALVEKAIGGKAG